MSESRDNLTGQAKPANAPVGFEFTGDGKAYYRIWIINLLFSILTLGIYSAWAKVRSARYFHANTRLAGRAFEFTGGPIPVLTRRLLLVLYLVYLFVGYQYWVSMVLKPVYLYSYLAVGVVLVFLIPWLMISMIAYRAGNTLYGKVRFGFRKRYGQALVYSVGVIILATGLVVLLVFSLQQFFWIEPLRPIAYIATTVWLLFMLVVFTGLQEKLKINNLYFGATLFQIDLPAYKYSRVLSGLIGASLFLSLISVMLGLLLTKILKLSGAGPDTIKYVMNVMNVIWLLFYFVIVTAVYKADTIQTTWNNTRLNTTGFVANYTAGDMVVLAIKNAFFLLITFGFYYPWARTNMVRYRLERIRITGNNDVEQLMQAARPDEENI